MWYIIKTYFHQFSLTIMSYIIFFLLPIWDEVVITIAVVFLDLLTGIWKAKKNKQKIQSRGFQVTISKIILYSLTILVGHGIDLVFFEGNNYVVKFFSGAVVLTEIKSLIENIEEITGLKLWDMLKDRFSFSKIK